MTLSTKGAARVGIGGPVGSGKTALVECLLPKLAQAGLSVAVITNDLVTHEDAERLRRKNLIDPRRILAVEAGACPHTVIREDPTLNIEAADQLDRTFPDLDLILIESGGDNLASTFSLDLVDYWLFVIDVAGGDDIPRKRGPGVLQCDLLVINKIDLHAYVGVDLDRMFAEANRYTYSGRSREPIAGRERVSRPSSTGCAGTSCSPMAGSMPLLRESVSGKVPEGCMSQLDLEFARDTSGRTGLSRRIVSYPFSIGAPFHLDRSAPDVATIFLQSASGGLFRDDQVTSRLRTRPQARARAAASSATIVHDARGGSGPVQTVMLSADAGSALAYLPRGNIMFPGSRLHQRITASLGPEAFLLVRDGFLTHRPTGMSGVFDHLRSVVELRDAEDRIIVADRTGMTGAVVAAAIPGIGRGFTAFGSLFLFSSHADEVIEEIAEGLRTLLPAPPTAYGAVTRLRRSSGLLLRVAAVDGGALEDLLDEGASRICDFIFR